MAARSDSPSHPKLSLAAPLQIPKDFLGSGHPIPLSPQWLLPKAGETKGMEVGENNWNMQTVKGSRPDLLKKSGNIEVMHDVPMKKNVFRPSVFDFDADRRDRWRDEERETNSSICKNSWKDGQKDLADNWRADRCMENSSNRHFGEARRASSDRRIDSSYLDSQRESKWNTRWGPDDKEPEGFLEKCVGSEKDSDMFHDRGSSKVTTHDKDDRERNHYRPWRSASSQSRGRGGPHHQSAPSKQGSTVAYGRGRGENPPPTFPVSHGRSGSIVSSVNHSNPIHYLPFGSSVEKLEGVRNEPYLLRYERTKLLDVYRRAEGRSYQIIPDGFVPVPSLTLDEPLQPLALCVPNPEEMIVLKEIEIGDVVSSGAPQILMEGQSSLDLGQSRRNKLAFTREDFTQDLDENKAEGSDESLYIRQMLYQGSQLKMEVSQDRKMNAENKLKAEGFREDGNYTDAVEFPSNRESSFHKNIPAYPGAALQTLSLGENAYPSLPGWRENLNDVSFRTPEKGLLQPSKNLTHELGNNLANHTFIKDNVRNQMGKDLTTRRQLYGILDEEQHLRRPIQVSPEDLRLYYQDPSGVIQGPFAGIDIIGWFEAGYFGLDLLVRLESAPSDSPFSLLEDVMPHLRAKAEPPPGFGGTKQIESVDAPTNISFRGFAPNHSGLSDVEMTRNEMRLKHSTTTEAENRFLESLMSSNLSSSSLENFFPEGMQVHFQNSSHNLPATREDGGNHLLLMAKRMALERQKSLPNTHQYWQGRDAASMVTKSDIIQDSITPHSKPLNPMLDNHRQTPYSQTADPMPILQGMSNVPLSEINHTAGNGSSFSGQSVSDALQSKIDIHHEQNSPPSVSFALQQQRFQLQKQPSLTNLLSQAIENPSTASASDKLLSSNFQEQQLLNILQQQQVLFSNFTQDPNVLNILQQQQQYLLQLHSQAPVPSQQMSLLDKLMLLKQQQKQEEQQQLLWQQQLLSQVLSEHQSRQCFGNPSYGQGYSSPVPIRNAFTDPSRIELSPEMLHNGSQLPSLNIPSEHVNDVSNMPLQVTHGVTFNVNSEASSLSLPNQILGIMTQQRGTSAAYSGQVNDILAAAKIVENSTLPNVMRLSTEDTGALEKHVSTFETTAPKIAEQDTEQTIDIYRSHTSLTSETAVDSELLEDAKVFGCLSSEGKSEISVTDAASETKMKLNSLCEKQEVERVFWENEPSKQEAEKVEILEPRKVSEKKSKRQKSLRIQTSSDEGKGLGKTPQLPKHPESEKQESSYLKVELEKGAGQTLLQQRSGNENQKNVSLDSQQIKSSVSENYSRDGVETVGSKGDMQSKQVQIGQRAWKPAPGFKAKSLLEIQEEEQKKAQTEAVISEIATSVSSMSLSSSWTGIVSNVVETRKGSDSKSQKSQLHDLLAEEVPLKSGKADNEVSDSVFNSSSIIVSSKHSESIDDDSFIEAKDTKKNRKKAAKAKGVGIKTTLLVTSVDFPTGSSPKERVRSSRQVQQEKEVIPAIPSGPALSDFVIWKGESGNSSPTPAWSTEHGKVSKPTSLREIQKEQERRISSQYPSQIPTPQKSQPTQISHNNAPQRSLSLSSPSKVASPISINPHPSSQSKLKGDEEWFWGPIDHSKQEQQVDFPQLATQSSWETRGTPGKGTSVGSLNRQRSLTGKASESSQSTSTSVHSSSRGKTDAMTKHSEAMDFRDWCESECFRLIGSKDTSFLEFCLKQSRAEAELLLTENLGSYDPEHEFIDKFLNYKELLSSEVLEIAFQNQNDWRATGLSAKDVNSADNSYSGDIDGNSTSKGGGKKKAKKGKKVSASVVLGFNVVSNRIMMGEIQTMED